MNDGNDAYEKNKRKRKIRSLENCIIIRYYEFREFRKISNVITNVIWLEYRNAFAKEAMSAKIFC